MWNLSPRPTKVVVLEEYKLQITFEDGKTGICDMKLLLDKPPFNSLIDINMFNTVRISDDKATLEWSNGTDICPDQLYNLGK